MIGLIVLGIIILLLVLFFIRSQYERNHPVLTTYEISSENIPKSFEGYEILYFTDLHGRELGKHNQNLKKILEKENPDAYFLGGDMLTANRNYESGFKAFSEMLESFKKGKKIYYAFGNHESRFEREKEDFPQYPEKFSALLNRYEITCLRNETAEIQKGNESILLTGLELPPACYKKRKKKQLTETEILSKIKRNELKYQIALCHSPVFFEELSKLGFDLTFAGHFHGGTIRVPGLGPLMTPEFQFFYPYTVGKFVFSDRVSIASSGLGTHGVDIRFLDLPEVVKVILHSKDNKDIAQK